MENKTNKLFVTSIILTVIAVLVEIFTIFMGVETLNLILNPPEDLSGIGLIVLLPTYLIAAVAVLVLSIISIGFDVKNIGDNKNKIISILLIALKILINAANIVMFIIMIA